MCERYRHQQLTGNMPECSGEVKLRPLLTLLSGLVESLFFTGIAYGWASLVVVFKLEGYFAENCSNASGNVSTDCSLQDEQFSQIISAASFICNIVRFPIGIAFDRCGTLAVRVVGILLYTSGTVLVTLSNSALALLLYPAMSCLITSGVIFYISNAQVGNLFPSYRSAVITVFSGAFDSSSGVFLFIKLLHERGLPVSSSFCFLSVCSLLPLIRTVFLMPRGHIPFPLPETYSYGLSCPSRKRRKVEDKGGNKNVVMITTMGQSEMRTKQLDETSSLVAQDNESHQPKRNEVASFRSCLLSWLFLWHLVWVVIIQFNHFLYLSTINPMLTRLARNDLDLVSHYTNAYGTIQLCGVFLSFLNSFIKEKLKQKSLAAGESLVDGELRSSWLPLFLASLECLLFCACFSSPLLPLQYLTFLLRVFNSTSFYGGHQAFVSTVFPSCHFGKLSGVAMSVSALVLLLQFPLLHLIQHQLHGDPFYAYVGVTFLSLFSFVHPFHVYRRFRRPVSRTEGNNDVSKPVETTC